MPQLRKDPVTARWVIVNTENPATADSFSPGRRLKTSKTCPFCPGNESMTPPPIRTVKKKGLAKSTDDWLIRVIPNKFPALKIEESTDKYAFGVYDKIGGFGAHEVIVETPDHDREIPDLASEHLELLLAAFRDRCQDLRKDPRFKYIILFKNYGADAGASQEHPHSQLIALPVVPSRVMGEVKGSTRHYEHTDRCIYCDMLNQERAEKKLSVHETAGHIALAPFASRFPFETWILPKKHESSFDVVPDQDLASLADVIRTTLLKLRTALKDPSYNLMIHSLPVYGKEHETFHWHIEIIPHLAGIAGFELGTGFYVNPTPPELAAATLRKTLSA